MSPIPQIQLFLVEETYRKREKKTIHTVGFFFIFLNGNKSKKWLKQPKFAYDTTLSRLGAMDSSCSQVPSITPKGDIINFEKAKFTNLS